MNRILLSALVSMLAVGCGKAAVQTHAAVAPENAAPAVVEPWASVDADKAPAKDADKPREVGDYVVYRFSGSFQKAPITLTERVVARDKDALVLDVVLDDGQKKHELRVRTSEAQATQGEILSVERIEKGNLVPMPAADYEALMAKTMLIADSNEAELGSEEVTVALGDAKIPAKQTSFRVKVGGRDATMRTVVSEKFPWGDVAGEIAADGDILYRAEIVTVGHQEAPAKPTTTPAVAESDYDDYE
ncbi:hypothetical protein [Polyangium aurulentum]|uniref:hypothetical protein n=1 Tax=Polyangium aurulentum TaxID=2567896 RepID=UPI0010ADB587|nr:hypothetical protein [Polyangium aurulentum]UQA61699.1 hypothetical protein E8A73_014990 [Polyangium aurulentum]